MYTLEICCYNLPSVLVAVDAGADRIELCMNPEDGGTTPSYGLIRAARERCPVKLYPIIRPRGGDFLYSPEDYEQMILDIRLCKELGCDGIVIGGLTQDGQVDTAGCSALVTEAGNLGITFHRAFDRAADPLEALEEIIGLGCERILTSGQRPTAVEGAPLLSQLVAKAAGRLSIMPGGGVRSVNIKALALETGAHEFHTAARVVLPSMMQFINEDMQEQLNGVAVNADEVRQMRQLLGNL
jgi:copper homeostasis protein